MTISLLTAKAFLAPTAGAVVVGAGVGGTYYVYTNRSTNNNTNNQTSTAVSTNSILARVVTTGADSTTINSALKCTIPTQSEVGCKVFKFNTPKLNNSISKINKTDIAEVATAKTDLVAQNYVVVELEGKAQTLESLKNKTISLKNGETELTTLHFDQLLVKETEESKEIYNPIAPVADTYIVSTSTAITDVSADASIVGFRCKYKDTDKSDEITNVDDSCKLFPIPTPATGKNITSLAQVKGETTVANTLTASTFYKLTLNKNQLYNLNVAKAKTALTVEVAIAAGNKSGNVTIHQQLINDKFVGATNLLIAKYVGTTTAQAGTDGKCSFNPDPAVETDTQFDCTLHTASPTSTEDLTTLTLSGTAMASSATLTSEGIFAIKLTTPKNIDVLTVGKNIYVHATGSSSNKVAHQLEIKALLSGSIDDTKKPFIIAQ